MFADTGKAGVSKQEFLDASAAAKHCGFKLSTFKLWLRYGFIPVPNSSRQWTREQLDGALEKIMHDGFGIFAPQKTAYIKIPNCQRLPRRLVDGTTRWHMRHRILGRPLPTDWRKPAFAIAVIQCERELITSDAGHAHEQNQVTGKPRRLVSAPSILSEAEHEYDQVARREGSVSAASLGEAPSELLTPQEVVARYRGRLTEGTLRNHRSRRTGPPYLIIMRQVFYPLPLLLLWEKANIQMCGLPESAFTLDRED
jgi:hypothetical protein